jgi:membrane protease YdiL (CAAX protease family)
MCLVAGAVPLAARWITDSSASVAVGLLLSAVYFGVALYFRRVDRLRRFWELALAFGTLALVMALNSALPEFVAGSVLHEAPSAGNPFAATVFGTVVVQLVEAAITIVPIVTITLLSGRDLASIYVRRGVAGRWLLLAIAFFALFYVFVLTIPLRPDSFAQRLLPTSGTLTVARLLALTPALVVTALSNGVEEEIVFRGLLLSRFNWFFGAGVANGLQALLFAFAHAGVTYTPSALVFIAIIVLPLGLIAGYLTRATQSVLTPAILHGALDMAIFLAFLSYAS